MKTINCCNCGKKITPNKKETCKVIICPDCQSENFTVEKTKRNSVNIELIFGLMLIISLLKLLLN